MKRIFTFLIAASALFGAVSCQKEIATEQEHQAPSFRIIADMESTKVSFSDEQTRIKTSWEDGDQVFGWWQTSSESGLCTFEVDELRADGSATLSITQNSEQPKDGSTLHLIYAPANTVNDLTSDHTLTVKFKEQTSLLDDLRDFSFMCASASVSGNTANLSFKQQTAVLNLKMDGVKFPEGASDIESYSVTGSKIGGTATFSVKDGVLSLGAGKSGEISVIFCDPEEFYINIPVTSEPTSITISAKAADGKHYRATLPGEKKIEAGKSYRVSSLNFEEYTPAKKSISILAIGNSFSVDALEYLYPMLQQAGYEEIILGNLYIGGCSLQTHADNLTGDKALYTYYKNSSNKWTNTSAYKASTALKERSWDYVSLQQASGYSGLADSYEPYLSTIIAKVGELCPSAKLLWHMTWAYEGTSNHSDFPKYNKNQMTMYNGIVNAVKTQILTKDVFDMVIPCGTAVQILRTSLFGDSITRDGYHMSYNVGRFLTAMMWCKQLSDCDLEKISYKPASYSYTAEELKAIKDAVAKAYAKPLEVVQSSVKDEIKEASVPNTELRAILEAKGYNLAEYKEIDLEITTYAFYNSTAKFSLNSRAGGATDANLNQFCATRKFTREQLVPGSILVQKSGYQYRPEGWVNSSTNNSSSTRPANTTVQITVVSSQWWGNFNYRAFNIAKAGNPGMTDEEMTEATKAFGIFIPLVPPTVISAPETMTFNQGDAPKNLNASVNSGATLQYSSNNPAVASVSADGTVSAVGVGTAEITITAPAKGDWKAASAICKVSVVPNTLDGIMQFNGKNPDDYFILDLELTNYAYYNSTATNNSTSGGGWYIYKQPGSSASNLNQFAASRKFSKSELPNGTCLVILKGYQYRPEGWQTSGSKNSSTRPGNITTNFVEIDNAWWGNFNYRAFNIAKEGNPALNDSEMNSLVEKFAIYVPLN